jgi:hypothetical protein
MKISIIYMLLSVTLSYNFTDFLDNFSAEIDEDMNEAHSKQGITLRKLFNCRISNYRMLCVLDYVNHGKVRSVNIQVFIILTKFNLHEAEFINCEDYTISLERSGKYGGKKTTLINGVEFYYDALFKIFTNEFAHQCNTIVLNAGVEFRLKRGLRMLYSRQVRPWERLINGELTRGTIDFFGGELVTKPRTVDGFGQVVISYKIRTIRQPRNQNGEWFTDVIVTFI